MSEPTQTPPAPPSPPPAGPAGGTYKKPLLAAFLSVMPGLGNIYNGLYLRGVLFFVIISSLIALTARGHDLLGFAIAFFWLFNVVDACSSSPSTRPVFKAAAASRVKAAGLSMAAPSSTVSR